MTVFLLSRFSRFLDRTVQEVILPCRLCRTAVPRLSRLQSRCLTRMGKVSFYSVKVGRKVGVYTTWKECELQTKGFSGAVFKGFSTLDEALAFANLPPPPSTTLPGKVSVKPKRELSSQAPLGLGNGALNPRPTTSRAVTPSTKRHLASPAGTRAKGSSAVDTTSDARNHPTDPPARGITHVASSDAPPLDLPRSGTPSRATTTPDNLRALFDRVGGQTASWKLQFDGGSRGNPGRTGSGAVLYADGTKVWECYHYGAHGTSNEAEYLGLINGLRTAKSLGISTLRVEGDSELVIRHMTGKYKVKAANLQGPYQEAVTLACGLRRVEFCHIPRELNAAADALANVAMDRGASQQTTFG